MSGENNKKNLPAGRKKWDSWLQKEIETLLDQIIINKVMLHSFVNSCILL